MGCSNTGIIGPADCDTQPTSPDSIFALIEFRPICTDDVIIHQHLEEIISGEFDVIPFNDSFPRIKRVLHSLI